MLQRRYLATCLITGNIQRGEDYLGRGETEADRQNFSLKYYLRAPSRSSRLMILKQKLDAESAQQAHHNKIHEKSFKFTLISGILLD
jgi:hypothetical protein